MSGQNIKKYYKFPIGGIVALVAGAILAATTFIEFLSTAILYYIPDISYYIGDFIRIVSFISNISFFVPHFAIALALLLLGILLIIKHRNATLLISPILCMLGSLSFICIRSTYLIFIIVSPYIISNPGYYIYNITALLGWVVILVAFVLFFIFISLTYRRKKRSLGILSWISGAFTALGYGFLTIACIASYSYYWLRYGITFHWRNLLELTNFSNTILIVLMPVVLILAGLWIANPYKKGVIIEELFAKEPDNEPDDEPIVEAIDEIPEFNEAEAPAKNIVFEVKEDPTHQPNLEHKIYALKKYKELLELGLISQEDFDKKKNELIDFIDS